MSAVAEQALAADPRARFRSASEMSRALQPQRTGQVTAILPVRTTPIRVTTSVAPKSRPQLRRRRRLFAASAGLVVAATLGASLFLFVPEAGPPTVPPATPATHLGAHTTARTTETDPERTAIRSLAAALGGGGLPGDPALARSLETTAAAPQGAGRVVQAEQALSLAQVLLDGGRITSGQYQDVLDVLTPTGATPLAAATVPAQPTPGLGGPESSGGNGPGDGVGHPHGHGDAQGDQG